LHIVLFVGIDAVTLEACRDRFRHDEGEWELVATDSGTEAKALLAQRSIAVLVSDVATAGLADGELLDHARRFHPDTARVVVSASTGINRIDVVVNLAHQFVKAPCHAAELHEAIARAVVLRETIGTERLREDLSSLAVLPTPPRAFLDVVAVLDSPTSDARQVAAALERDIGRSTKVLQLTNSSFFAPRSRVTSLNQAVVLMGRDVLRSVMLLDTVGRGTADAGPVRQWLVEINQRSWETAALARRMARPSVAEDAFCAALLLECGQLAFAASRPTFFAELIRRAARDRRHLDELEHEAFGFSHSEVGGHLLQLWGFPQEVADIVTNHADVSTHGACDADAAHIVQAAHQIVTESDLDLCANRHRLSMTNLSEWGVLNTVALWKGERHPDRLGRTSAEPSTLMASAIS
jgi:HD-like signal output (HDOD) protein